jgi:hypothetical protein
LFYPADMVCDGQGPGAAASVARKDADQDLQAMPLVESVEPVPDGRGVVGAIELRPGTDPFLLDHRFKGQPLLPAAIGLEALAEAAAALTPDLQVVGFRNVSLTNPLRFFSDRPVPARARARFADGAGANDELADCDLVCDFVNRAGKVVEADRIYVRGQVELASRLAPLPSAPVNEPDSWFDIQYLDGLAMWHGPVFRCLRQASIEGSTQWGRITAEPITRMAGDRPDTGWIVAANVFDACLYACGVFVWFHTDGGVSVPESFEKIRLGRSPRAGEACRLRLEFRGQEEHFGRFDFTLFGDDGAVIWQVEGYRNVIVTGTAGKPD